MLLQLNPALPVSIISGPGWAGPVGNAVAHILLDYGIEHDIHWVCCMDDTGEFWTVPNPYVRGRPNITLGRPHPERAPAQPAGTIQKSRPKRRTKR